PNPLLPRPGVDFVGESIGKTIKIDFNTQRAERGKFARISIEIDLDESIPRLCSSMVSSKRSSMKICRRFASGVEEWGTTPKPPPKLGGVSYRLGGLRRLNGTCHRRSFIGAGGGPIRPLDVGLSEAEAIE
ncbi:hypothetical protein LINPERHAP2_LOCUS33086, partial [Linum perenne]